MIDSEGYRPNVGIVICNRRGQLLWAKRIRQSAWQFPQGGINEDETIEQALFRELEEEVGLSGKDVSVLHQTTEWLRYDLPKNYIRYHKNLFALAKNRNGFAGTRSG